MAAGLAAPTIARQTQEPRISKDVLECAEKIIGIDFSDADQQQALTGVNNNLASFERLRNTDIPLDTEPAITFRPYLPGKKPKPGATPNGKVKVTTPVPAARRSSLEDLAFLPVTALAGLVRKRDVSSTELTRMYLDRLKKYGPKLNCVVTLTEELALAQAAQADKEIQVRALQGAAARHPLGREGSLRHQRHPHHLGRHGLSEPGHRLRRDRRRTAARRRRGARRQAVARRAGAGRQLVPRPDEEPVEPAAARADRRPGPARRRPPASSASRSAPKRAARSSRRRR